MRRTATMKRIKALIIVLAIAAIIVAIMYAGYYVLYKLLCGLFWLIGISL